MRSGDHIGDQTEDGAALEHHLHRMLSSEIVREHGIILVLGSMRAEERVAAFLLNLAQRLHARGFSSTSLVLRMTREELGEYLGLRLETVSRVFGVLQDRKLVKFSHRHVDILDLQGLHKLIFGSDSW